MGGAARGVGQPPRLDTVKHVPHMVVAAPWDDVILGLSLIQWRHLNKVLRMNIGDKVSYTDGLGTVGWGVLKNQAIERGDEHRVERPTRLTVAVAPPSSKDRQRFLVEKLSELGVERLLWLDARHGENRLAKGSKIFSWVLAATEQSRGAWLMEVGPDLVRLDELDPGWVACKPGGKRATPDATTVVIGPEGGFADDELPTEARLWDLGPTILRVETAAIAAVAKLTGG